MSDRCTKITSTLSNDAWHIHGSYSCIYIYIRTNRGQSIRERVRSIHAFSLIRTSVHYALVAYVRCTCSSCYAEIARTCACLVRVSLRVLAVAPLLIPTASSRRSFYGNLSAHRISRSTTSSLSTVVDRTSIP